MFGRWLTRMIDAQAGWAEPFGDWLHGIVQRIFGPIPRVKDLLHGTWLGHPFHAASTDLPIGVLGVAVLFDGLGMAEAAAIAVAAAVALMLLSALSGLADYSDTDGLARQRATVHATIMLLALIAGAASLWLRLGRSSVELVPAALSAAGFGLLLLGAFVGGDVVYVLGNMVDRHAFRARSDRWAQLDVESIPEGKPTKAKVGAQALVLVREGERILALHDVCSHAGCSLSTGKVVDGQIECPCHGSRYRLANGHVTRGPSVYDQPAYEIRKADGGWEARRLG
jgi:nitrite reductase/ring-hydroxylating ferredoxin subunit